MSGDLISSTIHSAALRKLSALIPSPWPDEVTHEIHELDRELGRKGRLERLLPPDLIDARDGHGDLPAFVERRLLTIMFVDIRNSTRIEEQLPPDQTIHFLNTYLGAATHAILVNNGSVYQFVGDGIVALFGDDEGDHGVSSALAAALDIHRAIEDAHPPVGLSEPVQAVVAIHTGLTTVGMLGQAERTQYALLGNAVNIAARMEGEAKSLGVKTVMTGQAVWSLAVRPSWLRRLAVKRLRGSSDTVEIWSADPPVGAPAPNPG